MSTSNMLIIMSTGKANSLLVMYDQKSIMILRGQTHKTKLVFEMDEKYTVLMNCCENRRHKSLFQFVVPVLCRSGVKQTKQQSESGTGDFFQAP